jgi:hypothetical protein
MSTMREIKSLSKAIEQKNAEIQKHRDDADRCRHMAEAGRRSMDQLEQLRARKAEIQAIAFVEKKEAETESIDAEILRLEQGTAETLAQARAARLALIMIEGDPNAAQQAPEKVQVARTFNAPQATVTRLGLQPNLVTHPGLVNKVVDAEPVEIIPEPEPELPKSKLGVALKELDELEEQRRGLVLTWLVERREKAIDRYMKALMDLGPIVAEASAADRAHHRFGDYSVGAGAWILGNLREVEFPVPSSRRISNPPSDMDPWAHTRVGRSPIFWPRDPSHGNSELEEILAELLAAGVVA